MDALRDHPAGSLQDTAGHFTDHAKQFFLVRGGVSKLIYSLSGGTCRIAVGYYLQNLSEPFLFFWNVHTEESENSFPYQNLHGGCQTTVIYGKYMCSTQQQKRHGQKMIHPANSELQHALRATMHCQQIQGWICWGTLFQMKENRVIENDEVQKKFDPWKKLIRFRKTKRVCTCTCEERIQDHLKTFRMISSLLIIKATSLLKAATKHLQQRWPSYRFLLRSDRKIWEWNF